MPHQHVPPWLGPIRTPSQVQMRSAKRRRLETTLPCCSTLQVHEGCGQEQGQVQVQDRVIGACKEQQPHREEVVQQEQEQEQSRACLQGQQRAACAELSAHGESSAGGLDGGGEVCHSPHLPAGTGPLPVPWASPLVLVAQCAAHPACPAPAPAHIEQGQPAKRQQQCATGSCAEVREWTGGASGGRSSGESSNSEGGGVSSAREPGNGRRTCAHDGCSKAHEGCDRACEGCHAKPLCHKVCIF